MRYMVIIIDRLQWSEHVNGQVHDDQAGADGGRNRTQANHHVLRSTNSRQVN